MDLSRFKSARHDADFFYLEHLDRGPFKVAKKGLSPALRRQIEDFCKGGMVQGLSNGGSPEETVLLESPGGHLTPVLKSAENDFKAEGFRPVAIDPATGLQTYPAPPPPQTVDMGFQDTSSVLDTPMEAAANVANNIGWAAGKVGDFMRHLSGEDAINGTGPQTPAAGATSDTSNQINFVDALLGRTPHLQERAAAAAAQDASPAMDQTKAAIEAGRRAQAHSAPPAVTDEQAAAPPVDHVAPTAQHVQASGEQRRSGDVRTAPAEPDMTAYDEAAQQFAEAHELLRQMEVEHAKEDLDNAKMQQELMNQINTDYTARIEQAQKDADAAYQDYLNTPFDPQRLFHNVDVGHGVLGAIGILLGGLGSGIKGEAGNPVMELISRAVERDVEAQRADLGRKQSAVSYYVNKGLNLQQAMQLAKSDAREKVAAMMAVTAGKYAADGRTQVLNAESAQFRQQAAQDRQQAYASAVRKQYEPAILGTQLAAQRSGFRSAKVAIARDNLNRAQAQQQQEQLDTESRRDPWLKDRLWLASHEQDAAARQVTVRTEVPTGAWDKINGRPVMQTQIVRRFATGPGLQAEATTRLSNELKFKEYANILQAWMKAHPNGQLFDNEDTRSLDDAIAGMKEMWPKAVLGVPSASDGQLKTIGEILGNPASLWQAWTGKTAALSRELDRAVNMVSEGNQSYLVPTRAQLNLPALPGVE